MVESAREIVREKGVRALWKGVGASLILVINPVLQYTAFEYLSKILSKWKSGRATGSGSRVLSDFDMFYLGAIAKLSEWLRVVMREWLAYCAG
jgi:adenine nucleotide transporter 17